MAVLKSIHERLSLELMEYIALGIYQPDDKLPSVRELSNLYQVNPNTIAKVYTGLEKQGYIYAIPAKGYYVAKTSREMIDATEQKLREMFHLIVVLAHLAGIPKDEVLLKLEKQFVKELTI